MAFTMIRSRLSKACVWQDVREWLVSFDYVLNYAAEIATVTYRSGPEWEQRFGRQRMTSPDRDDSLGDHPNDSPSLGPDFLIESYLAHQVGLSIMRPPSIRN